MAIKRTLTRRAWTEQPDTGAKVTSRPDGLAVAG